MYYETQTCHIQGFTSFFVTLGKGKIKWAIKEIHLDTRRGFCLQRTTIFLLSLLISSFKFNSIWNEYFIFF